MTLYRQLVFFAVLFFFILFAGTWFVKFESTRSFLTNQLESHAQDTASSLSLAVSQYPNDMVSIETMINALFDRGYYEAIRFIDPNGKKLLERNRRVVIEGVPAWFIKAVPLKAPEANAYVMTGWRQSGTIYVKSHAGYAYNSLWQDAKHTTLLFVVCGIFVFILGGLGLRMLLRPLSLVEQQAEALCRREYEIQRKIPKTRELQSIVLVMNRMTEKIKEMFYEQVRHAEELWERAYSDPLTGIGNRRYLESQATAYLDNKDRDLKGVLLLIRVHGLEVLNNQRGFQIADELLKGVAASLREIAVRLTGAILGRLSGSDFILFLPDYPSSEADRLSHEVTKALSGLSSTGITATENVTNVGVCTYDRAVTFSRLLSEADLALSTAFLIGPNTWNVRAVMKDTEKTPLGRKQWKELLERALKNRHIRLYAQSVVRAGNQDAILHLEILSRIDLDDGKVLSANAFIPIAERLKLVSSLDRMVVEEVIKLDRSRLGADTIAVNLSASSFQDELFVGWLHKTIKNLPVSVPRIIFEFAEFGAVQNEQLLKSFAVVVHECGHKVGLDHYGQSGGHLKYLRSLQPDYVKIDQAYTAELKDEDSDSRFFISSICSVAHSIDVVVIAEGVETENQRHILQRLNIDAVQGYLIDRPKPLQGI